MHIFSKLSASLRDLRQELAPMTWMERIDHIWTYYKEHMIFAAFGVLILAIIVSSVANRNTQTLLSGLMTNVSISVEGKEYLSTEYFECIGADPKTQKVSLLYNYFKDMQKAENVAFNYDVATAASAMVGARSLDYIIMDEMAFRFYAGEDIFADLREIFTAEELEVLEDTLIYLARDDEQERFPVAVDLTQTPFAHSCVNSDELTYIAFAAGTPHAERCKDFLRYILAWPGGE